MSTLYLTNSGRTVMLKINDLEIVYTGPKNLVGFSKINRLYKDKTDCLLYADSIFLDETNNSYIEEDYIDIKDLLLDYFNTEVEISKIISSIDNCIILNKYNLSDLKLGMEIQHVSQLDNIYDTWIILVKQDKKSPYKIGFIGKETNAESDNIYKI